MLTIFNEPQFQAGRRLLEWPAEWKECTPAQRGIFRETFHGWARSVMNCMDGGEVAAAVLKRMLAQVEKLCSVTA